MASIVKIIEVPDVPVPLSQLTIGMRIPCDMFIRKNGSFRVLLGKNSVFTDTLRNDLKEKGIAGLFIYTNDSSDWDSHISAGRLRSHAAGDINKRQFNEYSHIKEQYFQIDASMMEPGTLINFPIFMLDKFIFSPLTNASPESPAAIDKKIFAAAGDLLIRKSDVPFYIDYLASLRQSAAISDSTGMKIKTFVIKETAKIILKDFLLDPRSGAKVKEIGNLVKEMIDCVLENRNAVYTLLSLKGHDYYTYTHSVNVAALSVSLGIAAGLSRDEIEKLGMGAILHDIGKSAIPHNILNKQGNLSIAEYNIIKSHVMEGENLLKSNIHFPEESFIPVLQHHEKLSGRGYPQGLKGAKIDILGRITAIADCYDALTTQRPYKDAYQPFHALSVISKETEDYDASLLRTFIRMLGKDFIMKPNISKNH